MMKQNKQSLLFWSFAVVAALSSASFAQAAGTPRKLTVEQKKEAKETVMKELKKRVRISEAEMKQILKSDLAKDPQNKEAWNTLLINATTVGIARPTAADFKLANVHADLVAEFVKMNSSGVAPAKGSIETKNLLEIQANWTVKEKENFVKVFARAVEIAKAGKVPTQTEAFHQALEEAGLLKKYEQRCK